MAANHTWLEAILAKPKGQAIGWGCPADAKEKVHRPVISFQGLQGMSEQPRFIRDRGRTVHTDLVKAQPTRWGSSGVNWTKSCMLIRASKSQLLFRPSMARPALD